MILKNLTKVLCLIVKFGTLIEVGSKQLSEFFVTIMAVWSTNLQNIYKSSLNFDHLWMAPLGQLFCKGP